MPIRLPPVPPASRILINLNISLHLFELAVDGAFDQFPGDLGQGNDQEDLESSRGNLLSKIGLKSPQLQQPEKDDSCYGKAQA